MLFNFNNCWNVEAASITLPCSALNCITCTSSHLVCTLPVRVSYITHDKCDTSLHTCHICPVHVPRLTCVVVGQSVLLQACESPDDPTHCWPPFTGAGESQLLVRDWLPFPHVTGHVPYWPQGPHDPSTEIGNRDAKLIKNESWRMHKYLTSFIDVRIYHKY